MSEKKPICKSHVMTAEQIRKLIGLRLGTTGEVLTSSEKIGLEGHARTYPSCTLLYYAQFSTELRALIDHLQHSGYGSRKYPEAIIRKQWELALEAALGSWIYEDAK